MTFFGVTLFAFNDSFFTNIRGEILFANSIPDSTPSSAWCVTWTPVPPFMIRSLTSTKIDHSNFFDSMFYLPAHPNVSIVAFLHSTVSWLLPPHSLSCKQITLSCRNSFKKQHFNHLSTMTKTASGLFSAFTETNTRTPRTPFWPVRTRWSITALHHCALSRTGKGSLSKIHLKFFSHLSFKAPYIVKFDGEQGDDWYPAYFNVSGSNHSSVSVNDDWK